MKWFDFCLHCYQLLPFLLHNVLSVGLRNGSKINERHTNYTQKGLLECAKLMVNFHEKAGCEKLISVHNKYNTLKYGYATSIKHALIRFTYSIT
ncbi:g2/mitotic-specific cyclin-2 [Phtheirospermum japonicum]|uniref:G2/mitotic-specific cyclin-2 n=1 Tax=Phtheirospermum japonicum TaxID=374723 RepID=A0A830CAZ0_9LAMI|nr:g2/mitotic-specific cyclin-2 [Phtheirospermum japonicum]